MTEGLTQESLAGVDPGRKLTVDDLQPVLKHRSAALVEPDVAGAQTWAGRAKEDQTDASAAWRLAEECGASAGLGPVQCGLKPRSARCWHEKR